MNLGEKTKKNLEEAFAGESMARNRYTYFAKVARTAGYVQIANVFEETANHEKEHAKQWAKLLGLVGTLEEDLKSAIEGEAFENSEMYPRMATEAKEEGHVEISKLFEAVGDAEKMHEARFRALLKNVEENTAFKKGALIGDRDASKEITWKCGNCGYLHKGEEAPDACPACAHAQKHFELFCENY